MRHLALALALAGSGLAACGRDATPLPAAPVIAEADPGSTLAASVRATLAAFEDAGEPGPSRHEPIRAWIQAGETGRALAALEPLSTTDASGEAAFLAGWTLHNLSRYALALPHLLRALEGGPGYPQAELAFFLAGRCLQERGQLEPARAAFEGDITLRPGNGEGSFRLAQILLEEGELEDCRTRAMAALERYTRPRDQAKVHALLADVHLAEDRPAAARESLERCVELFPHYEAFYRLSQLCRRAGDTADAERYLALHEQWRRRAGR